MENQTNDNINKNLQLMAIARKRVKFKEQLGTYIAVNSILWLIWLFTSQENKGLPWPAWTSIGWGIGLIFSYAKAYKTPTDDAIEKEYQKLKNK